MQRLARPFCLALALLVPGLPLPAVAQGAQVAFGTMQADTSLPVEVTADQLEVDQADGTAVFTGNVTIGQGAMRLTADRVRVEYAAGGVNRIARLLASGNVTLASGNEAAEAQEADYSIDDGRIVMTGDVLMTQGQNALSGERMVVDLTRGTALVEGRVRTILAPGQNAPQPAP
ncbi:lipopolysaccharide transport periplasmic protein LptA [Plastorhodobacter daqingensis]|uniref:Lipopolysaccharide transport periplasmic protein LptA n=1 Tax=Plastorhodobacter daqingensis TaxID=1387281 RepID=A0ABW2UGX8_9RHOB